MSEINCYIPIKLRITGRPSDSQLDQLGDALVRALAARMGFAERVIEDRHGATFGGDSELVREAYEPEREEIATDAYRVPSYNDGGAERPLRLLQGARPQRPWSVRKAINFHATVEEFIDVIAGIDRDQKAFKDLYHDQLKESRWVEAWLVKVNHKQLLKAQLLPQIRLRAEELSQLRGNQNTIFVHSTSPDMRQQLSKIAKEKNKGAQLLALDVNEKEELVRYAVQNNGLNESLGDPPPNPELWLLPGATLLFAWMILPRIELADRVMLGSEKKIWVSWDEMEIIQPGFPAAFDQEFSALVKWRDFKTVFGDKQMALKLVPFRVSKRTSFETLEYLIKSQALKSSDGTSVPLGDLYLLHEVFLNRLPKSARSIADWFTNDITRPLNAESRLGQWEKGWAGAYIYADVDITEDQIAAAKYLPGARVQAKWLRNTLLQGDPTEGKWSKAMLTFLSDNYDSELRSEKRPPGGGSFEYLLEALERDGAFDKLFDKVISSDHESLQQLLARLSLATRYATHERVRRLLEPLASRTLRKNLNSYWEQEQEIWIDRNPNAVVKAGEVLGDIYPNLYIFKRKAKRIKPSRISDCRKALTHEQVDLIGKVASGKDTNEYTQEDFVIATTCAAIQSVDLTDDIEEITIQRSLKLVSVKAGLEKALPQYKLTFHVVERIAGEREWHIVSTQTIDQSVDEFEADQTQLRLGDFGKAYEKVMTGVLAVGVIGLAWEVGLIAVLVKMGGGLASIGVSITISEAMLVVRWFFGDAEITPETVMHAALEGYLNAIGFKAAGFAVKLAATKLGTGALKALFTQRLLTGIVGGGGSTALVEFADNFTDAIIKADGKWSDIKIDWEKIGWGAFFGALFETGSLAGSLLLKAVAKKELQTLGQAVALARREGITSARWLVLATEALGNLRARLNSFVADAVTRNFVRATLERVLLVYKQLGGEYQLAVFRNVLESASEKLSPSAAKGLEKLLEALPVEISNDALSSLNKLKPYQVSNLLETLNRLDQSALSLALRPRLAVFLRVMEQAPESMSRSAVQGLEKFLGASRADLSNEAALSILNNLKPNQLSDFLEVLNNLRDSSTRRVFKFLGNSNASQADELLRLLSESGPEHESRDKLMKLVFAERENILSEERLNDTLKKKKNPVYREYSAAREKNSFITSNETEHYDGIKALDEERLADETLKQTIKDLADKGLLDDQPRFPRYEQQTTGRKYRHTTFHHFIRVGVKKMASGVNIYLHVKSDRAMEVMKFVVRKIVDNPGEFPGIAEAKVAGGEILTERVDTIVIYAENHAAAEKAVKRVLTEYHSAHDKYFQTTTPPMTKRIANGVSIGERPENGVSFGQARSNIILRVLKESPNLTEEEFIERVLNAFAEEGIDPELPHKNLPRSERVSRGDAEVGGNSEAQAAQSSLPGSSGAEIPRVILNLGPGEAPPTTQSGKATQSHMTGSSGADKAPVILYRGTTYQFIHGGSKNLHDLGDGLYLTFEPGLALQYAQEHRVKVNVDTPGAPGIVIRVETTQGELGRVLDFYNNKVLKDDWEAYLEIFESGRNLKKGLANENYSRFFETWLKNKGVDMSQFDTIIGPEYVRGGSQICVRNKAIAERLIAKAEEWARAREPLGPAYPDPALPIDKKLLDKLKE